MLVVIVRLHVNIGMPTADHEIDVVAVTIVERRHEKLKLLLVHEQIELAAVPGLRCARAEWHGDVRRKGVEFRRRHTWLVVTPVVVERPRLRDRGNRRSLGRALVPFLALPAA